MTKLQVSDIV